VFITFISKNVSNVVGLGDSEDVQSMSKGMKDKNGDNTEKDSDKNNGEDGGNDMDVGGEGRGKPQGPHQ